MSSRNKEESKKRLLEAVGRVMADEGFEALGINRIAREAGVDKVLIYRYFGGITELVTAYSNTIDFWPDIDELLGPNPKKLKRMGSKQQLSWFFKSFIRALRRRPQTQKIMIWWSREPRSKFASKLDDIRMKSALEFFERLENIPVDRDLTAVVVILYSAISRLLEQTHTTGYIGGIDLTGDRGWKRIEEGIDSLIAGNAV